MSLLRRSTTPSPSKLTSSLATQRAARPRQGLRHALFKIVPLALLTAWSVAAGPALAQPASMDRPVQANQRPDAARSDQPLTVNLFGRPTTLRLSYELSMERRRNFDLNDARDRDRRTLDQELKVDARLPLLPSITVFAQTSLLSERRRQPATGTVTHDQGWQRGELWVLVDPLPGSGAGGPVELSLQAGRIPLVDGRTWWWDEDLDAVRLAVRGSHWRVESGVGRELARKASFDDGIDLQHRGVRRWFGQARWDWAQRQSLELFWLRADDRSGTPLPGSLQNDADADPSDARLRWLGLRASGTGRNATGHRWAYWVDLGMLRGSDSRTVFSTVGGLQRAGDSLRQRVRGQAIDAGAQWTFGDSWRPTLTVALAQGSGAAPEALRDGNYRQTGLQENKVRMSGMKRLQRYGELFDPELSNLRVGTVSFGLRPLDNASVEVVWHSYHQVVAAASQRDTRLSQAPEGLQRRLGQEVDLLFAWRPTPQIELTLLLARFLPGAAYAVNRRDPATSVELGLDLKF
jgi:alginate production protein